MGAGLSTCQMGKELQFLYFPVVTTTLPCCTSKGLLNKSFRQA
jgi:hypothetical protein